MKHLLALLILFAVIFRAEAKTIEPLEAPGTPWETSLNITPKIKYGQGSIFGQGSVPTYRGMAYGADVEYMIGTPSFSLAPFFELVSTNLKNNASTSAQSETLDGTFASVGVKLRSGFTFAKMGYSQLRLKDRASGTINNSKSFRSDGLELGAGLIYQFSELFAVSGGVDLAYYKISPTNNSISSRLDYIGYSMVLGLSFSLPSGGN